MAAKVAASRLELALMRIRSGETAIGRDLLRQIVAAEPANKDAWMWLAHVGASIEEKRASLHHAYLLDPHVHETYKRLLTPAHIAHAARSGVFICYARPDELFALDLTESLRATGIKVWLDMTDMPDDADWHTAITAALDGCGVMLLLLSPEALSAVDVRTEQQHFLDVGKIVVPVLHKTCEYSVFRNPSLPIDFRHDYDLGLQHLLRLFR